MTPEGKVKKDIKKVLEAQDIFYFMPVNNGMGKGGVSDFIGVKQVTITADMVGQTFGRFVAIEAKAHGNRPTARQYDFLGEVEQRGGLAMWCDSAEGITESLE